MKNLSLFTFSLFLVLLGVRLFSIQSSKFDEVGRNIASTSGQKEEVKSVFEMEPEKARALLDDLDLYVKKSKERTIKKEVVAQDDEQKKKEENAASVKKTLEKKYVEFDEALMAQENNMLDIKYMQDEIKRLKKDAEIELNNSEIWSTEFMLMLMMQEQFTLRELNELKGPQDLGLSVDQWIKMKETAQSTEFRMKIKTFKGITDDGFLEEVDDMYAEGDDLDSMKEETYEPFEQGERNRAIENFAERNKRARNGENNDIIAVDPEPYEDDGYYEEGEQERMPANLEDQTEVVEDPDYDNEREIEYKNYNDGYEDEY